MDNNKCVHKITVEMIDGGPWTVFVWGPINMPRGYLLDRLFKKFPSLDRTIYHKVDNGEYADDRVEVIE